MSERIIEDVEELDALMQRYPDLGMLAVGSDCFVMRLYDQQKNELKVTVQAGERTRYEETRSEDRRQ